MAKRGRGGTPATKAAGADLIARVERRIDTLARAMIDTFVAELPVYSHLPREQLTGEILAICRENLRIFFRCLREARPPSPEELAEPKASAARRAEERVPLAAVLSAYHVGGRIGWTAIADESRPDERDDLVPIGSRLLSYMEVLSAAVASAYVEEQQVIYGEQRDVRRAVIEALLTGQSRPGGEPVEMRAARGGLQLAEGYLVLALRLGQSADERDAGVTATVAGRRKVRRLEARLDEVAGPDALTLLDPSGGIVLVPAPDGAPALDGLADLVSGLAKATEATALVGAAWRPGASGVAAAAAEAREVLRLAHGMNLPAGGYRLEDVLFEHALTSPPMVAERLAQLLSPLDAKHDLVETLECWFGADFDRRAAAARLNVHPNTLDYRLRRIGELTGIEPGTARGLQLLGAALTARHLGASDPRLG